MIKILEMALLGLFIVMGTTFWIFFMYTFIRDDIRSERRRKEKLKAGEDPDRWSF